MQIASGAGHGLCYFVETNAGLLPPDAKMTALRHTACSLGLSRDSFQSKELRSDRQIGGLRTGANKISGNINFELSFAEYDPLFEAVLGNSWVNNVLKTGTKLKSLCFERTFSSINYYARYLGCYLNKFSLSIKPEDMVTGSFEIMGLDSENADQAIDPDFILSKDHDAFDSYSGVLKEGGTQIAVVTSIDLNLDNGISPQFVIGKRSAAFVSVGRSTVNGKISAFFESGLLIDKFLNEQATSLEFTLGGTSGSYTFLLPNVKYTGADNPVQDEGPVLIEMPFTAILDVTAGTNLQITRNVTP